jgi:hypothetical protein
MSPRIIPFPSGSRGPKKNAASSRYFPYGKQEPFYVFCQLLLMTGITVWAMYSEFRYTARLSSLPLNVMFCSMVLYWAFIHQQIQRSGFIRKNWILLAILATVFVFVDPFMAAFIGASVLMYLGFFGRTAYGPSAFVRYHLLSLIIAVTMLLWLGLLGSSLISLAISVFKLLPLGMVTDVLQLVQFWGLLSIVALIALMGLFSAIAGLVHKTVNLPFVTRQVTYWA